MFYRLVEEPEVPANRIGATDLQAGEMLLADVHALVQEQTGLAGTHISGDYPNDWVGVEFTARGNRVRVYTVDLEVAALKVVVFTDDRAQREFASAEFSHMPAGIVGAIVTEYLGGVR